MPRVCIVCNAPIVRGKYCDTCVPPSVLKSRKYYQSHKDAVKAKNTAYMHEHWREYYEKNKDAWNAASKRWVERNIEHVRARKAAWKRNYRARKLAEQREVVST